MGARVLVTTVQVPFTRGGAEILTGGLVRALGDRGFEVDVVQLPFSAPKESLLKNMALWKALDLSSFNGRPVDLVIGTKFPAYLVEHRRKVVWLVHQHRQSYELFGTHFSDFSLDAESEALRRLVVACDREAFSRSRAVFTISQNVSARLERFLEQPSEVLTPPLPLGDAYRTGERGDYILAVGRICRIKRIDLLLKSLPQIDDHLKLKVVGVADEPGMDEYLASEIDKHHLWHRVEFLGRVDDSTLLKLFAEAFAVYYAPFDEDYGFVTLEALASGKPVVTANDSGGVLAFVRDRENGLIASPAEESVAGAFNALYHDDELYRRISAAAPLSFPRSSWDDVVQRLTGPLSELSPGAVL